MKGFLTVVICGAVRLTGCCRVGLREVTSQRGQMFERMGNCFFETVDWLGEHVLSVLSVPSSAYLVCCVSIGGRSKEVSAPRSAGAGQRSTPAPSPLAYSNLLSLLPTTLLQNNHGSTYTSTRHHHPSSSRVNLPP